MNTAEIKKLLEEKYIGKPFSRYGCGEQVSSWNVARDIKEMVEKLLPKGLTVSADEENQHTSLYIYTRSGGKNVRTYIARVGVSKAKGNLGALAKGNAALATGTKTLMGELGPELVVSHGRYFLAGQGGAEFVNLDKDAIVFNHQQTERLLA
jgi:hypothetical protein